MIHDTIKQRLRVSLRACASGKSTLDTAAQLASELGEDGAWSELDERGCLPGDTDKPAHLLWTRQLARARHLSPGEITGPTLRALDWWLSQDSPGDEPRWNPGTATTLIGEIALLCEGELSTGAMGKVVEILARSHWAYWKRGEGWVERQGTVLMEVAYHGILRGCLENNSLLCETAFRRLFRGVIPGQPATFPGNRGADPAGEPYQAESDLSYTQEYAQLVALAHGTPCQAPVESVKAFVAHLLDFQQWMIRRGRFDGNGAFGAPETDGHDLRGLAAALVQLSQLGNPPRRAELMALAERLVGEGKPLSGHRYFWRSQAVVHQRPSFYSTLQLGSTENRRPTNGGDGPLPVEGAIYFMRHGREYAGLTQRWNAWAQKDRPGAEEPGDNGAHFSVNGTRRFAGAVSDAEYGMAALEIRNARLQGKRSWFFFDESVVCLDADVRGTPARLPVYTTVNRCRLGGPVTVETHTRQRRTLAAGHVHDLRDARRVEHDGLLYHFIGPAQAFAHVAVPSDEDGSGALGGERVLALRIDHGAQPEGTSSAYAVLPMEDEPGARERTEAEISQIEVLANTAAIQAVRHRGAGLLAVTFWEPGVVALPGGTRAAANRPCLMLCRENPNGHTTLSVSNPLRAAGTVHVEYGGQCLCFELPGGPEAGRTLRREL